ncbi:hypothetical protein [Sphingobacterium lumbrici]|uniref:hypothetical protein n=1 Tax=Sphingobacterium lumbrici TaxID=2559600 RepID=UPI00112E800D|nr:hypothetical protein [Sphingobacterium lumbrici]
MENQIIKQKEVQEKTPHIHNITNFVVMNNTTISHHINLLTGYPVENTNKAFKAGANSIVVVSAICTSSDPRKANHEHRGLLR